jgi:exo-beta-1,3-glucanase (GH17 family)
VVETRYVFVDIGDTATVTTTEYDDSAPSGAWRVKRGIDDVVPTSTAAACGCFEKVITTWVPYEPEQVVFSYVASSVVPSVASSVYSSQVLPVSIPSIAPPPASSTYTPPAPAPVSSTYTPVAVKGEYYQVPSPSSTPAAAEAYVAPEGGLYCLTYTPYDSKTGGCKSASSILLDLAEIKAKGFPHIRLYGVDCNQLTLVAGPAVTMGLKVTLGVFFDGTGAVRGNADLGSILSWAQWTNIEVINIGIPIFS